MPIMKPSEIEQAVLFHFDEQIDLCKLFWGNENRVESPTYKAIFINETLDSEEDIAWYGERAVRQTNLVLSVLRDYFYPMFDTILVEVNS
jgi:hypothetical protein